ncbi:hypothetical protein M3P05_06180 [Sansalvadorimonas sp. 2012CJ34-2]|uniref:Uncharacterized protein n=1 Tax=Parendozoicomonas callyspongiae TaxID=2942213 RepID=A0ABT0PFK5_9GAMM|nr:hypothetical protein [Sansalvadorimonas sp. 2012CJ34-2]MCL6269527.1 hypothetical protein [Sansalvadorimonas sp. 2012CJ34-2]
MEASGLGTGSSLVTAQQDYSAKSAENKYHDGQKSFCRYTVLLVDAPVETRLRDAVNKLARIKSLRLFLPATLNMGDMSNQLNLLHVWQTLSPGTLESVEIVIPLEKPRVKGKLEVLAGLSLQGKSGIKLEGLSCSLINESDVSVLPKAQLAIKESIYGKNSPQKIAAELNSQGGLVLTPYHWQLFKNEIVYIDGENITSNKLILPEENHLPVNETKLIGSGCIAETYQALGAEAQLWQNLLLLVEQGTVLFSIAYGLHRYSEQYFFLSYIKAIVGSGWEKPTVVYVASDVAGIFFKKLLSSFDVNIIESEETLLTGLSGEELLQQLLRQKVTVLFYGGLPKPVFEKMVKVSNIPIVLEGANTAELAQSFGKPYVGIQITKNMPTRNSIPPEHQQAFSFWVSVTALLHNRRDWFGSVDSYYKNIVKAVGLAKASVIIDQIIKQNNQKQTEEVLDFNLSEGDKVRTLPDIDSTKSYIIDELIRMLFCFTEGVKEECFLCDFIPAFFNDLPAILQPESRTQKCRAENVYALVEQGKSAAFCSYLEQQLEILLQRFISDAITPNSTMAQLFEAIRRNTHASENNALVFAMNQIDFHKLGIE